MFDQEDDPELDDEWLTTDDQSARFRKSRQKVLGRFKRADSPYVTVPQNSEEDIVVRERAKGNTERPSQSEIGTGGNH